MSKLNAQMLPGTRVKLSGKFLRNTGQALGDEGQRRWVVQECPCRGCKSGRLVATDQEGSVECYTPAELQEHPYLRQRHIARSNLVIVGKPSVRND